MKTTTIRQTVSFKAAPRDVFEALMDSKKHSEIVGAPARISRKVGGKISVYGGEITGKNLKLVEDKEIVQEWRYSDWPPGHYSVASFEFKKEKNGTKMVFVQAGVPADKAAEIAQGWKDYYWQPMKQMLEGK